MPSENISNYILSILDEDSPNIVLDEDIPNILYEAVYIELNDNTYMYGEAFANIVNGEVIQPYLFRTKAEISDPDGSYTEYYEPQNLFIVYDSSDYIIRIVETSTCRSDDLIKYDFNTQNGELSKVEERYKTVNRILFYYNDGICSKIELDEGKSGCYYDKIGNLGPTVDDILGWYFNE